MFICICKFFKLTKPKIETQTKKDIPMLITLDSDVLHSYVF